SHSISLGTENYDATVASMIVLLRYGTGAPVRRPVAESPEDTERGLTPPTVTSFRAAGARQAVAGRRLRPSGPKLPGLLQPCRKDSSFVAHPPLPVRRRDENPTLTRSNRLGASSLSPNCIADGQTH